MADGAAVVMMEQVPEPENRPAKRQRFDVTFEDTLIDIVPLGTTHSAFPRPSLTWTSLSASPAASPAPEKPAPVESPVTRYLNYTLARKEKEEKELARIKAEAVAQLEKERQEAAAAQAKAEKDREAREAREAARRERKNKPERTAEEKETLKEKQLHKLISAVVIPCLSKYKSKMEVDVFKKHAKDVCVPSPHCCIPYL
jgi:[histone H3]-lysine36 N-trimethyltransferase